MLGNALLENSNVETANNQRCAFSLRLRKTG